MGISRRKPHISKLLRRFLLHNSNGFYYTAISVRMAYALRRNLPFVNDFFEKGDRYAAEYNEQCKSA